MVERTGPVACVLAICALVLMPSPVMARNRCAPVVEAELTKLGIDRGRLTDVVYGRERASGDGAPLIAIIAWNTLKDCDGAVIIQMWPDCRFKQAYAIRSCKITGLYYSS